MKISQKLGCCIAALSLSISASADQDAAPYNSKLDAFLAEAEASPLAPPSYSLAIANGDKLLYSRLKGPRILGQDSPLELDSPLYIASVTKSFVGLLAARLDAEGVLSLDATLADEWPSLELPAPIDAAGITMRDLLTHNFGFENDPLVVRTAYVGGTSLADYEAILEGSSVSIEPGFSYDNLGYLIYAAVLEQKTGRSWHDWLASDIFQPLGLASASTKPSEISSDKIALGNHYDPNAKEGWTPAKAKADDLMHPAGGLFVSTGDAVRWLQANVTRKVFADAIYEVAQTPYVKREKPKKYADMTCTGYALGWQTCDYAGHRVLYHGGTYDGMMIFMLYLPDDDLVVSSINGARAFGWTFGWNAVQQGLDYALGLEGADDKAIERLAGRVESQLGYANFRGRIREQALRGATMAGAAKLRQDLIGLYSSDAYGEASLCEADGKLTFKIGRFSAEVISGPDGVARIMERAYGEPSKLKVEYSEAGMPSFEWEGGQFEKQAGKACVGEVDQSR
ncbi:serine hydrolase domain-containing protein [Kordiimonas lipolytica]|uniref:Serine hydrolase domain-containing protein n=1 Tax=Kordiimonas lipolytica TaxID=1662421 RepID=A0ABV8UCS2_9PROT|nr:serine hydrolase [Kordiimonas lipolytica]